MSGYSLKTPTDSSRFVLKDLKADIEEISYQAAYKEKMIQEYQNCLDILSEKKEGTKTDLFDNLGTILQVGGVSLNKTKSRKRNHQISQ